MDKKMASTAAGFDSTYYLTNNADVVLAISQGNFANALDHYNSFGGKELRQPNVTFNPSYYAINNSDVLSSVSVGGFNNVFDHYSRFGEEENRAPSVSQAGFNATTYLAANTDVAAAVTAGSFSSALDHFISFGQAETRTGSGVAADTGTAGSTFSLTTGADVAGETSAVNGTLASTFRFTDTANEVITGGLGTLGATDILVDGSTTDTDVLNVEASATTSTFTAANIETINFTAAAGTPILDMTNVSGTTAIKVDGNVNSSIEEINTQSKQPEITIDSYGRVLTINAEQLTGTTALSTAETINVTLSGATHGSSAAARTNLTLTADAGTGTLENLNITSGGSAANAFTLDSTNANVTLSTVNFLGSQDLTTRTTHAEVTGITLDASGSTATSNSIRIDKAGTTTASTNANLFTGFDNILMVDSTAPAVGGDSASLQGLKSGQQITLGDDFNTTVLGVAASGSSDTITIVLDNETASTDLDVAALDIQNVETVTIQSSGNVTTSTTLQNLQDDFTGDATTITVTGDTSLNLDLNIDAPSSGSRSVTVDASANTSFVDIAGATQASVSYSITGTAGNDILTLNGSGGTLVGGAGNDTLTGGAGNDTITTGEGTNGVGMSAGTDTITVGSGVDTLTVNAAAVTSAAQVTTLQSAGLDIGVLTVTVDGKVYNTAFDTDADTTVAAFVTAHATNILSDSGVTVVKTGDVADDILTFTGASAGTAFVAVGTYFDATVGETATAITTAGIAGVTTNTTVTGFSTGTNDDIISVDVSAVNATGGIVNVTGFDGANVVGADAVVLLDYVAGVNISSATTGQNIIKVAYSNTLNQFSDVSTALDINNIIAEANITDNDVITMAFYDADSGNAEIGFLRQDGTQTSIDNALEFVEVATMAMTITEYNALSASNFSFVV
jgi:hypothetical protein